MGALLGEPTVRTPAALEALWARVQPERAVRLDANVYGDRLALSERDETAGGEARCTLELVMKAGLNHAFAIHHWRPPVWQRPIAELAATHWPPPPRVDGAASTLPVVALMPALVQPLLGVAGGAAAVGSAAARRAQLRLRLLSTDPMDHTAMGLSLLRLLDDGRASEARSQGPRADEHADDLELVAGVVANADGLVQAEDALLLQVASAARHSRSSAVQHAALVAPPLSAAAAILCGGRHALGAWARALAAGPVRCLRLSARAVVMRLRPPAVRCHAGELRSSSSWQLAQGKRS